MIIIRLIKRVYSYLILFLINHFLSEPRPSTFELKRKMLNSIGFKIGKGSKIVGPIYCTGQLVVGENTWIGRGLSIHGDGTVKIGDCCDFGPNVSFLTGGHKIGEKNRRAGTGEIYNISVGRGTWVGANVTILGNTTVGDSCVVAACSCVTRDVKANSLMGGVPAKLIRELL